MYPSAWSLRAFSKNCFQKRRPPFESTPKTAASFKSAIHRQTPFINLLFPISIFFNHSFPLLGPQFRPPFGQPAFLKYPFKGSKIGLVVDPVFHFVPPHSLPPRPTCQVYPSSQNRSQNPAIFAPGLLDLLSPANCFLFPPLSALLWERLFSGPSPLFEVPKKQ